MHVPPRSLKVAHYISSSGGGMRVDLTLFLTLSLAIFAASCTTSSSRKGASSEPVGGTSIEDDYEDTGNERDYRGSSSSSGALTVMSGTVVSSVSNSPLTTGKVPSQRALNHGIATISAGRGGDKGLTEDTYLDALTATRLGGGEMSDVLEGGRALMKHRVKNAKKDLPELAKLEIGLAAIQSRNLARARIFLDPLLARTKNPRIKAAIHNAYGIAALQLGQTSNAAQSFKRALSNSPNYPPAVLNIGFLALKFGHYREAQKHLSSLQNDWYARIGLITADRQSGAQKTPRVKSQCQNLTQSHPKNKIILFNCGLFYLQTAKKNDKASLMKARTLIEGATQQPGGEALWDEVAFRVLEKIQ